MIIQSLSDEEKRDWLRLIRTENVGPITFHQLMRRFGSAKAALDALPSLFLKNKSGYAPRLPPLAQIEDEMAALRKMGGVFLARCEPAYPEALAAIEDAPPVLCVRGNVALLQKRAIGIVGSRNASLNGRKMAERLARDLGSEGLIVTSGLARGIDTAAHQGSLDTGTIGVLAGGVDIVYPEENKGLYEKILEKGGTIVSDQPVGGEPKSRLFPKRNRIISGLSLGVVVVEAAPKSGSLITARMALEQGREVFAVPGSPLDPRANGTNDLIRQGAIITERVEDILHHIYPVPPRLEETEGSFTPTPPAPLTESELASAKEKILENLSPSPTAVDELVRQCQLSPQAVLASLLELELAGMLERQPGNKVALLG